MKSISKKILIFALALAATACSKDSSNPAPEGLNASNLTEKVVQEFSESDGTTVMLVDTQQIVTDLNHGGIYKDLGDFKVIVYSCVVGASHCDSYLTFFYHQLISYDYRYYDTPIVSAHDGTLLSDLEIRNLRLGVGGNWKFKVPGIPMVQVQINGVSGHVLQLLPLNTPSLPQPAPAPPSPPAPAPPAPVQPAPAPPPWLQLPVGPPYGSSMLLRVAAICNGFQFTNDRVECVKAVANKKFSEVAIPVCEGYQFSSDKQSCLLAIADQAFQPEVVKLCQGYQFSSDKQACLQKLANAGFPLDIIQTCQGYQFASDRQACLEKFKR